MSAIMLFVIVVSAIILITYSVQEAGKRKRQTERGERPPRID